MCRHDGITSTYREQKKLHPLRENKNLEIFMKIISVQDAYKELVKGDNAIVVDVRTPSEHRSIHIENSKLIPLEKFKSINFKDEFRDSFSDKQVYINCATGMRSKKACQELLNLGFTNFFLIEGGINAWEKAGLPVKKGRQSISIQRQIQIVVGSAVLLGTGLGLTISPYFYSISVFFGGGLLFAGLSNTCMLAILLTKMPWNR
jgi:rhodanese-related sulfurtransferase